MSKKEKFELSHDQRCVMARFIEFVNGSGSVFILKGYAGTGKTTMVKEMVKMLKETIPSACLYRQGCQDSS